MRAWLSTTCQSHNRGFTRFLPPTLENLHLAGADRALDNVVGARRYRAACVDTYLHYLTEEHAVFGVTFQYWMLLVVGHFIVWIGLLKLER